MAREILIPGNLVPIFIAENSSLSEKGISLLTASTLLRNYVYSLEPKLKIRMIIVEQVDFWGKKVGQIRLKVEMIDERDDSTYCRIVISRGGAVGVLIIVVCEGEAYALMLRQPRVAIGQAKFLEIPAGLLDGSDDPADVAVREVKEEVGIVISKKDLVDLCSKISDGESNYFHTSCGILDETITLLLYKMKCSRPELEKILSQKTGLPEEHEDLTLELVRLDEILKKTTDTKSILAYLMYKELEIG